eukprot:SAG31_NODE_3175_length_4586_cov_4.176064_4_plen_122_part_00
MRTDLVFAHVLSGWTNGPGNKTSGGGNGGPDGVCRGNAQGNRTSTRAQSGGCDCGHGVACGEYLWDHRNGSSLTDWFIEDYIGGETYGLGNPNVDGCKSDKMLHVRKVMRLLNGSAQSFEA